MKKRDWIGCLVWLGIFIILMVQPPEAKKEIKGVVVDKTGEPQPCSICHQ